MSERPWKKQKIENKDRNILNSIIFICKLIDMNLIELDEPKNYFEPLFLFDWFLIELGRKLISNDDQDLISILLLNKAINKRATLVFREYFLNFELQSQIQKLGKRRDFNQIQQLFEKKGSSLNPNINFDLTSEEKMTQCVHDENVLLHLPNFPNFIHHSCVSFEKRTSLVVLATRRSGLDSLVKLLLFHPRISFLQISQERFNELFNWSVLNGHLDVCELLLKNLQQPRIFSIQKNQPLSISRLDWQYVLIGAVKYNRFEIFKLLTEYCLPTVLSSASIDEIAFLELCDQFSDSKMYELILDCQIRANKSLNPYFRGGQNIWKDLVKSISIGSEYLQVISKFAFDVNKNPYSDVVETYFDEFTNGNDRRIMKSLLDSAIDDSESVKIALKVAFSMGFDIEFKLLLNERDWSERELLDLFHTRLCEHSERNPQFDQQIRCLEMILNRLDKQKQFLEHDFETLLNSCQKIESIGLLKLIWNDKRIVRTQQWTHSFVLNHFSKLSFSFIQFLIPHCQLSDQVQFKWDIQNQKILVGSDSGHGECITTQFRNLCFLILLNSENIELLEQCLDLINFMWTPEVLKLASKIHKNVSINWIWESIPESFWEENTKEIQSLLVFSCESLNLQFFESILKRFPEIDLRANNNEAIRSIFSKKASKSSSSTSSALSFLKKFATTTFRFKDSKEQLELAEFAMSCGFNDHLSAILKIKLFENWW